MQSRPKTQLGVKGDPYLSSGMLCTDSLLSSIPQSTVAYLLFSKHLPCSPSYSFHPACCIFPENMASSTLSQYILPTPLLQRLPLQSLPRTSYQIPVSSCCPLQSLHLICEPPLIRTLIHSEYHLLATYPVLLGFRLTLH